MIIRTLKFRVNDKYSKKLNKLANEVNFVWNYVNDLSFRNIRDHGKFMSGYDYHPYLVGCTSGSSALNILMHTVQETTEIYVIERRKSKKRKLKWRKSTGSKRSLGWVPFKTGNLRFKNDGYLYYGKLKFKVWDSYGLENYKLKSGSFNEDSRGKWYLNITVEVPEEQPTGSGQIGIDLGLKELVTTSDGQITSTPQFYRELESKLKIAQRARKKKEVKNIHAKIANRRKDSLHKLSNQLVKENNLIVVGNVSSSKLAKTNMAKSVYDAGWGMLKTMLEYKAIRQQVKFIVVNEAYTTQICNVCKNRTGPKGLEDLGIREWTCQNCNSSHNRDVNSAKNILALGLERLAEGNLDK